GRRSKPHDLRGAGGSDERNSHRGGTYERQYRGRAEEHHAEEVPEYRHERPVLLRLHERPGEDNGANDNGALHRRRHGRRSAQRVRRQRQRQDEERRPEISEWSEVSRGRERERMPRVFARRVAARGDPGEHGDERRGAREDKREPLRPEEGRELRRSRSRDVLV